MKPIQHAFYIGLLSILAVLLHFKMEALTETRRLLETSLGQLEHSIDIKHGHHSVPMSTNGLIFKFKE
jgi:hypothetical protein